MNRRIRYAAVAIAAAISLSVSPDQALAFEDEGAIPGLEAMILEMALQDIVIQRVLRTGPVDPGPNNVWVGFDTQSHCGTIPPSPSQVPGGFGPCFPSTDEPLGAGLQQLTNLTPAECYIRAAYAMTAIEGTAIGELQTVNPNSGVSFGATPDTAAGGVCSGKSSIAYQFVGVMNHQFLFLLGQRFSKPHCAFLVNLCEPSAQGCSCDGYIRPGGT